MSQSDDPPPPRRPLFVPVIIATVLLSVIGMSAGLVLGSRHEESQAAGPQHTDQQTNYRPGGSTSAAGLCPPEMRDTARKVGFDVTLTPLLTVRAPATDTMVWICQDGNGHLYYQANRGGPEGRWVEGETALFLSDVVRDGSGYLATAADGNTFRVDAQRLVVVRKGQRERYDVVPG